MKFVTTIASRWAHVLCSEASLWRFCVPCFLASLHLCSHAGAQRLIDRAPFDQIVLDAANGNAVLDVFPLDFPNRQVPQPLPSGQLEVRLLKRPADAYEVSWSSIAEVRLYEEMVLDESRRLAREAKFDEAFDHFMFLADRYPGVAGLDAAVQEFLQANALDAYKRDDHDRALAILHYLYERNSAFPGLARAVDAVGGKVIESRVAAKDYAGARSTLELLRSQFQKLSLQVVVNWQQRFETAAQKQLALAEQELQAGHFAPARRSVRQAVAIWPNAPQAAALLRRISEASPSVAVGVFESTPETAHVRLDSWPTLRTGQLTQRFLAELTGYTSEGGRYESPIGNIALDASGKTLSIQLAEERFAGAAVALQAAAVSRRCLEAAASSGRFGGLHELVRSVRYEFPDVVHVDFHRLHVRPESLLDLPLPEEVVDQLIHGPYVRRDKEENRTRFDRRSVGGDMPRSGIQAVEEIVYENDDVAMTALATGEVDLIDRVPPWHLARIRSMSDVRLGEYRLPTVHVLIPHASRPLPNQRECRRALCYGLDRERILREVLLGGESSPGFQVVSGPFPAGKSLDSPIRYAYNAQLQPREYDPRLALLLFNLAWSNVQKRQSPMSEADDSQTVTIQEPLPPLRLAHSSDPVARTACQTIELQLELLGLDVELIELSTDDLLSDASSYDFRYAELAVWEPVTDAPRLLGPGGYAGSCTDHMLTALLQLEKAENWTEVRKSLSEIHSIASGDLPVIPLWQTVNYFAYRGDLRGITDAPVLPYQNIHSWRREFATAQVQ